MATTHFGHLIRLSGTVAYWSQLHGSWVEKAHATRWTNKRAGQNCAKRLSKASGLLVYLEYTTIGRTV